MIRYRNKIQISETRNGEYIIESDRGSRYLTNQIVNTRTPVTDWFEKQHPSDLRQWQKDAIIKSFYDALDGLDLFVIYKQGAGYSQPHDMILARKGNLWIFATEQDTWFVRGETNGVIFNREDSMGSILDRSVREEIYLVCDGIKAIV